MCVEGACAVCVRVCAVRVCVCVCVCVCVYASTHTHTRSLSGFPRLCVSLPLCFSLCPPASLCPPLSFSLSLSLSPHLIFSAFLSLSLSLSLSLALALGLSLARSLFSLSISHSSLSISRLLPPHPTTPPLFPGTDLIRLLDTHSKQMHNTAGLSKLGGSGDTRTAACNIWMVHVCACVCVIKTHMRSVVEQMIMMIPGGQWRHANCRL